MGGTRTCLCMLVHAWDFTSDPKPTAVLLRPPSPLSAPHRHRCNQLTLSCAPMLMLRHAQCWKHADSARSVAMKTRLN